MMRDALATLLAVWPVWTGVLLVVWWISIHETAENRPPPLPCVALALIATLAWVVGFVLWIAGLS